MVPSVVVSKAQAQHAIEILSWHAQLHRTQAKEFRHPSFAKSTSTEEDYARDRADYADYHADGLEKIAKALEKTKETAG